MLTNTSCALGFISDTFSLCIHRLRQFWRLRSQDFIHTYTDYVQVSIEIFLKLYSLYYADGYNKDGLGTKAGLRQTRLWHNHPAAAALPMEVGPHLSLFIFPSWLCHGTSHLVMACAHALEQGARAVTKGSGAPIGPQLIPHIWQQGQE